MESSVSRALAQRGLVLGGAVLWGVAEVIALFRARRVARRMPARH